MRSKIAIVAALLVGACDAKANDGLLASELTWSESKGGWSRSIEFSPWLADRPDLVRRIRGERIAAMTSDTGAECEPYSAGGTAACEDIWTYAVHHNGKRLVSLSAENTFDGGGAHPITTFSDYLYDVGTGEKLRFGDLFISWERVRPLLQKQFCQEVHSRNAQYACPAIEKQAVTLMSSASSATTSSFLVETQDYALGSYADGTETISIGLSPAVLSLIKPEFRGEFAAAGQ